MDKPIRYLLFSVAFLLLLSGCSGGCSSDTQKEGDQQIVSNDPLAMIIKQRSDSSSIEIASQLTQALDYTKIPYQSFDMDLLGSDFKIPSTVQLICLTATGVESFNDRQIEELVNFVAKGNTLFITSPVFEDRINFLLGIKKNTEYVLARQAEGFRFNEVVFPGYQNESFKLKRPFYHNGLAEEVFKDDIEIVAHSYDSTRAPVITRNRIAKGQVVMFNSITGYEKLYRGLLYSIMLSSMENIPYPVANVSSIFLDDFPLPLYNVKSPPIDWEYDVTEEAFITKIWWPDMQALADSFNIDYTAVQAFNYNANVVPPFDFNEWEASSIEINNQRVNGSVWLAQQVKNSRHELGFHGYNHFSLLTEEWPNRQFMVAALKAARKRWSIDNLGPLPVSYVPPTNNIDSVGIEALSTGMPQIKNLSSLYLEDIEQGGGREFGPDPYNPRLFDYPRISSGFIVDDRSRFTIQGLYLLTGIWTHFVHPDDVFQVTQRDEDAFASRNELGLGWHRSKDYDYGLYEAFVDYLNKIQQNYPLINYRTVDAAVPVVKDWRALQLNRGITDSLIYAAKQNNKDKLSTWFAYVKDVDRDSVEKYIQRQADEYHLTPFWDGYLVQFNSRQDSLVLPQASGGTNVFETPEEIQNQYLSFLGKGEGGGADIGSETWQDNRLRDTRAALRRNPSSRRLQERVIDLAVEFGEVPLTIDILEERLLTNDTWRTDDIERLLTYYGWEGESERAYDLLEQLWDKHRDESIITFKEMMVERYGSPGEEFQSKWLKRELALNPGDERVLEQLVLNNQSPEAWPETKEYLHRLIEQNPDSDSLYHYTLQRSFYYDEPQQTLDLLETIPDDADPQLQPLASEIANLYAYTAENYGKALVWADRADTFPKQTKLYWLLQQKRYKAFIERGDQALESSPKNDSLRVYVGQQLIYAGFYDEGYQRLYPLFEKETAPAATQTLVHTEIGYQPYEQKKTFYKDYPAFFSDSLEQALQHQYRTQEGTKVGLTASYSSDNFDNNIGRIGTFAEWGNRQKYIHRITAEETFVGSNVELSNLSSRLFNLNYSYQRLFPDKGFQFTAAGGFYYDNPRLRPDAKISAGYAKDSTFTSAELNIKPVFTNTALGRDINEIGLSIYREDFWSKGRLQTTASISGKRYSNDVSSFEALGRLYAQLPFSTTFNRIRGIAELSFSDASTSFTSGIPYYTPDKLLVKGLGIDYRYRDLLENPNLSFELEVMGKHSNNDGYFLTSTARLNARLKKYWELSLNADISSSSVYRYNQVGLTVSYLFPKYLQTDR